MQARPIKPALSEAGLDSWFVIRSATGLGRRRREGRKEETKKEGKKREKGKSWYKSNMKYEKRVRC